MNTGSSSPEGYTTWKTKEIVSGRNNMLELADWGNKNGGTYSAGTYCYEIWANDKMLYSKDFVVY